MNESEQRARTSKGAHLLTQSLCSALACHTRPAQPTAPPRFNERSPLLGRSAAAATSSDYTEMSDPHSHSPLHSSPHPAHRNQTASQLAAQERADAEYARRLAQEEEMLYTGGRGIHGGGPLIGGPGAGPIAAAGGAGGGGGAAGPQREAVRAAVMGELLTQRRFTQISFWVLLLLNLPQLILIVIFSLRNADRFNSCDRPLNLWLILHAARLVMTTFVAALPLLSPRRWSPNGERFQRMNESANLLAFITFIIGNFCELQRGTHLLCCPVVSFVVVSLVPCLASLCRASLLSCPRLPFACVCFLVHPLSPSLAHLSPILLRSAASPLSHSLTLSQLQPSPIPQRAANSAALPSFKGRRFSTAPISPLSNAGLTQSVE